jgi:hypothetical protein
MTSHDTQNAINSSESISLRHATVEIGMEVCIPYGKRYEALP